MKRTPMYLTIIPTDTSLDTPHGSREGKLFINGRGPDGSTMRLHVADGRRDDLFALALKMFNARHGAWMNNGEQSWQYLIQETEEVPPQLTEREKQIIGVLRTNSHLTVEELSTDIGDTTVNVSSALRFLHENGFVVMASEGSVNRFSIRKDNRAPV